MTTPDTSYIRKRGWIMLAASAATSYLVAAAVIVILPKGIVAWAVHSAVLLAGLGLGCLAYWRATRPIAGDRLRAEVPAIVALAALMPIGDGMWLKAFEAGSWSYHLASLLQTAFAVAVAMLFCKWLMAVDNREANETARPSKEPAS